MERKTNFEAPTACQEPCLEIGDVGCNLKQFDGSTWLTLTPIFHDRSAPLTVYIVDVYPVDRSAPLTVYIVDVYPANKLQIACTTTAALGGGGRKQPRQL